jgi:hypothetical protein
LEVDKHPQYAKGKIYNTAFFEALAEIHPETVVYSAHRIVPDIHFSNKIDVYPIALVRHPLLRSSSSYRYARIKRENSPRKETALTHDFAGWIEWCLDSDQRVEGLNYQSCVLSLNDQGQFMRDLKSNVRRGNLEFVYQRLDAMPVVGVVEMFDLSLDAINRAGQKLFPGMHIRNDRANSTKIVDDWQAELKALEESLPRPLLNRFYAANSDDLAMFDRYRLRLEQQHGPSRRHFPLKATVRNAIGIFRR